MLSELHTLSLKRSLAIDSIDIIWFHSVVGSSQIHFSPWLHYRKSEQERLKLDNNCTKTLVHISIAYMVQGLQKQDLEEIYRYIERPVYSRSGLRGMGILR